MVELVSRQECESSSKGGGRYWNKQGYPTILISQDIGPGGAHRGLGTDREKRASTHVIMF